MPTDTSEPAPRRRRDRKSPRNRASTGGGLPQLPWTRVVSPFPPVEILSADQLEAIHNTSMRILEELGIELMSASARAYFKQAGAEVDDASGLVKVDRGLIAELVAKAPSNFTLTPRNPEKQLHFGGANMVFGLVAGPTQRA